MLSSFTAGDTSLLRAGILPVPEPDRVALWVARLRWLVSCSTLRRCFSLQIADVVNQGRMLDPSHPPAGTTMTLCPIALVASCAKCPAVSVCPLKSVIGDVPKSAAKLAAKAARRKQP